jgi:excisionase family DNA binding protein
MESMMTARQVAELLGVHENWVYDQAASGALPSYKIGGTRRFDRDELRDWIAEHRQAEPARHAPRRNAGKAIAAATTRQRVQHGERKSEDEQPLRVSRRTHADAGPGAHAQPAPRLFEI